MTAERWRQIKALFQSAVERPAEERDAFLVSATPDDAELRREVESLLVSDAAGDTLLDRVHRAGVAVLADAPRIVEAAPERRIGPYEIGDLVGMGSMGEVYRARDTRLNRDVALKVLPPLCALDADRLARFRREAQVLALLNHPHIAAIYGIEDSSNAQALVLELVEGPTLADRIAMGPLPLHEALAIATQIAEAIEAAHEKGIIHRDLKPANIKIDALGRVKVLDFGLAKAVTAGQTPDLTASHDGLILGTASYMSPEQARGQSLDRRCDIWAFGCVFYEMLTGELAFPGATVPDTIARILEREPDWSALPETTPPPIRRVLLRCLVKDPKQRLRDIGDIRLDLNAVDEVLPGIAPATPATQRSRMPSRRWLTWAAIVGVGVSAATWALTRSATQSENPLANARFTPLTNWDGAEEGAEISPDGRFVAFLSDHDGEFDIWLSQIGSGHFTNLTREVPPLAPSGSVVRKLGFSPDAAEIWFNPAPRRALLLLPLTGGTPRAFLAQGANTPAWSPDGGRLVYFTKPQDGLDPMYVADRTGANPRQLITPQKGHSNNPVWSPDGQWIYFVSGPEPQDETDMNVWRAGATGGEPEQLTDQHEGINFLAPLGNHTLLYTAKADDGSGPWLWSLDVDRKHVRRVSLGVTQYTSVASSRDGRRVVATVANPSASLWRVPLLDRVAEDRDAVPYTLPAPTGRAVAPRFGESSLFYLSARGTGDGLWKVEGGQSSRIWRDVDGNVAEPPAISPDGRQLAIVVRRAGKRHLSIMSEDGTSARALAPAIEIQGAAGQAAVDWSPDGAFIVAGGKDAQGPALFKIPVDGSAPQRLLDGKWNNPLWSPDGNLIVYAGRSVVGQVTLLGIRPDGTPVKLPDVRVRPGGYRFLRNGSAVVYLPDIHAGDFWLLDLAAKRTRPLTHFTEQAGLFTFDITPDGKHIVFDRSRQNSDIVVIELPER